MNSFIHSLNHLGANFADFTLSMLVQSSLLIVLLFALDLGLRNKVRAVVRYGLWMLVLIKLVLPPSLAAPTSLAYWLPEKEAVNTPPALSQQFVVRYSEVKLDAARPLPSVPPPRAKLQFAGWLLLGWLAIAVGLMAWLVRRSRSVAQTAARAFPASESPEQLLDACRPQMGIRQRVRLKLSATAGSPAVCGLWRPVILVPQQLADKLSALQLRAVLLHELAHIKRGDVWVHYAQTLLQICYWWHPLLWLANAQIRRVREQAVDEAVVVAMGSEAEAYPATLVEVAKLAFQRPALALGLIGIVESKSTLAQRIQRLLDRPVPKSAKLGLARLVAVALVGAVLLPMARGERKPGAHASTPRSLSQSAAIEVEVKFVSLTDAALENLLGYRPKTIAASGHIVWTLSTAERIELLQRMERQPDAATLSAPRATTTSARQAQIAVDGIQPFLHPRAHTSAACQIIPYQIGSSLDLAVSAKITESGDVGSAFGAELSRNQKEDTNDARSGAKSNQVYAVNAVGYINYDVGTAHAFVGDGGAVILQNPALTGANGRRILVVVSPRVIRQSASVLKPNPNTTSVAASPSTSHPSRDAIDTPRPPTNSPKSQLTNALTGGKGQRERFASSTGQAVEIEAIKSGLTQYDPQTRFSLLLHSLGIPIKSGVTQYDPQTGICVVSNDFVARLNGAVLTARSGQFNTKTGEVMAEGGVTLQRGDQVLRAERLQYNFIQQKVTDTNAPSVSTGAASASVPVLGPGRKAIQAKLNRIVLPQIVFDNVPLPEVLQWLAKETSDRDPDGTGLNFLLNPNVIVAAQETIIDPTTGQPVTLSSPQPLDISTVMVRIVPPLKNVSLNDALETVVKTSDKPIRYSIEEYAVIFSQNSPGAAHRETRTFILDPKTFLEDAHRVLIAAGWSDIEIFGRSNDWKASLIRNFFESMGVTFVPPNTIYYSEGTGGLMVHASAVELDRVQKAVDALNALRQKESTSQTSVLDTARSLNIEPFTKPSETIKLETRVFRVSSATLLEGLKNTSGVPPHSGTIDSIQDSMRAFLTAAGVNVQPPNAVFFNHRTSVLMVRATSTELDTVQKALELLNYRPPQITIEAKFMEVPTETVAQLGLDLPPPDRASNTWTRILTAAQTGAVLHAAEQHAGVDILSTPKITTLSGRQSQIQAVDIRTVVTGIDPKALAPPGVQSTNSNPAQPYLTSQVPCGPTLDVVPSVAADGYTIHLAALPQVTEFLRYDTTLNGAKETRVWVDGKKQNVPMPLPVIRTRQMQASVDVYDGQTLVLGSPSVTMVSQQSNGQSVTNAIPEDAGKRLLVFITPTIIDPAGNPIHMPGREPFPANKPPPQQTR